MLQGLLFHLESVEEHVGVVVVVGLVIKIQIVVINSRRTNVCGAGRGARNN